MFSHIKGTLKINLTSKKFKLVQIYIIETPKIIYAIENQEKILNGRIKLCSRIYRIQLEVAGVLLYFKYCVCWRIGGKEFAICLLLLCMNKADLGSNCVEK